MKARLTVGAAVFLLTAGVTGLGVRNGQAQDFDYRKDFDDRILKGFRIAPVPLNIYHLDPALVGLGSYIVNAQGACNDCHTAPPFAEGGDPFRGEKEQINPAGYLAGGAAFGPFISRNLTPRANGMPANLTFEQFRQVLRKGTDFKNRHPEIPLLQVMPWPVYGKMSALEIRAIYEYLRAIPSLPTPTPPAAASQPTP
jgi:hypothetical protein